MTVCLYLLTAHHRGEVGRLDFIDCLETEMETVNDPLKRKSFDLEARSPALAAIRADRRALESRRREIEAMLHELARRAREELGAPHGEVSSVSDSPPKGPLGELLARLVRSDRPEPDSTRALHGSKADLEEELRDIREALRQIAQLEERARVSASAELCADLSAEYNRILAGVAHTAVPFAEALARYAELHRGLALAKVSTYSHLPPLPLNGLGDVLHENSDLAILLRDLVQRGALTLPKSGTPQAWLPDPAPDIEKSARRSLFRRVS